MSISTAHLRAFHGVAREGGYSKAARVLNVSQPTLSLRIKALEEGYGVNLFERLGRGVRLTAFGGDLLQATTRLFASMDEVEDVLVGARDLKTGNLNLGVQGMMLVGAVAGFWATYNIEHLWDGVWAEVSTDGGSTWYYQSLGITTKGVRSIIVDPKNPDIGPERLCRRGAPTKQSPTPNGGNQYIQIRYIF